MKQTLQINNLLALRGSSFRLDIPTLTCTPQSVLCITGPNGSGKSTLIECITGLLTPSRGSIVIEGKLVSSNLRTTRAVIGYIPDDDSWFIKELSANEYLDLLEGIYREAGAKHDIQGRRKQLAQELHFTSPDVPLQQLSHGNKKKVQIIAALMHNPRLVIMDEVRNGLDPFAVIAIERIIRQLTHDGVCVITTSHDLWWSERIATDVLVLMDGKIVLYDTLGSIRKRYGHLETAFTERAEQRS